MLKRFYFLILISILCIAVGIYCVAIYFRLVCKPAVDIRSVSEGTIRGEAVCYSDRLIVLDSYAESAKNGYTYFLAASVDEKGDVIAVSFSPQNGSEIYKYCLAYCEDDSQTIGDCVVQGYFLASNDILGKSWYFLQACKVYGLEGQSVNLDYICGKFENYHMKLAVKYIMVLIAGIFMLCGGISLLHRWREMYGYDNGIVRQGTNDSRRRDMGAGRQKKGAGQQKHTSTEHRKANAGQQGDTNTGQQSAYNGARGDTGARQNTQGSKRYSDIDSKLAFLRTQIGAPYPIFRLKHFQYYFDQLTYEAGNAGAVTSMVHEILRHYGLDPSKVRVNVIYEEADGNEIKQKEKEVRGSFASSGIEYGEIRIYIKSIYSEYDTVIAIALHECAHYYMYIHHYRLDNMEENERLTDLTAIYLGGGSYIGNGYFISPGARLGYLEKEECMYAIERVAEEQKKQKEILWNMEECRSGMMQKLRREMESTGQLVQILRPSRLVCEPETMQKLGQLLERHKQIEEHARAVLHQLSDFSVKSDSQKQLDGFAHAVRKLVSQIKNVESELRQYIGMQEFQEKLSPEVLEYIRNISALAASGNVFSMYDKLKFYCMSEYTGDDAAAIFERISLKQDSDALYVMGQCYETGTYADKDQEKARHYYKAAAESGSKEAQEKLRMEEFHEGK